jgi:hypothetical protein
MRGLRDVTVKRGRRVMCCSPRVHMRPTFPSGSGLASFENSSLHSHRRTWVEYDSKTMTRVHRNVEFPRSSSISR